MCLSFMVWLPDTGKYYGLVGVIEFVIVSGWIFKQVFITRPKSDPFNKENYCILLAPVKDNMTMGNALRPSTWGLYGGRILIADKDAWLVYQNEFAKKKLATVKKAATFKNYVLIDTGMKINEKQNEKLDNLVGDEATALFHDCAKLNGGNSLAMLLIRRQVRDLFNA